MSENADDILKDIGARFYARDVERQASELREAEAAHERQKREAEAFSAVLARVKFAP